jgi:hypothetical protein
MPNWCNNNIELYHEDKAMIERAKAAFDDGRLLNEFIPLPKELEDTTAPARFTNEELQEKYGASDWYSWCVNNWGTKWDISPYGAEINEHGVLVGAFDSPWGPPIEAYAKFQELGFEVRAYFNEPGMGFCGLFECNEESYDYSGMSADEAEEYLPEALNEMYCITENMREWEEENGENDE